LKGVPGEWPTRQPAGARSRRSVRTTRASRPRGRLAQHPAPGWRWRHRTEIPTTHRITADPRSEAASIGMDVVALRSRGWPRKPFPCEEVLRCWGARHPCSSC
jgi:hypothetical protein